MICLFANTQAKRHCTENLSVKKTFFLTKNMGKTLIIYKQFVSHTQNIRLKVEAPPSKRETSNNCKHKAFLSCSPWLSPSFSLLNWPRREEEERPAAAAVTQSLRHHSVQDIDQ